MCLVDCSMFHINMEEVACSVYTDSDAHKYSDLKEILNKALNYVT